LIARSAPQAFRASGFLPGSIALGDIACADGRGWRIRGTPPSGDRDWRPQAVSRARALLTAGLATRRPRPVEMQDQRPGAGESHRPKCHGPRWPRRRQASRPPDSPRSGARRCRSSARPGLRVSEAPVVPDRPGIPGRDRDDIIENTGSGPHRTAAGASRAVIAPAWPPGPRRPPPRSATGRPDQAHGG
jgi:hypothetical protein